MRCWAGLNKSLQQRLQESVGDCQIADFLCETERHYNKNLDVIALSFHAGETHLIIEDVSWW